MIRLLLNSPLLILLLARLLAKPMGATGPYEYNNWLGMYDQLRKDVQPGESRMGKWLYLKLLRLIDQEREGLIAARDAGIVVVCGGFHYDE